MAAGGWVVTHHATWASPGTRGPPHPSASGLVGAREPRSCPAWSRITPLQLSLSFPKCSAGMDLWLRACPSEPGQAPPPQAGRETWMAPRRAQPQAQNSPGWQNDGGGARLMAGAREGCLCVAMNKTSAAVPFGFIIC